MEPDGDAAAFEQHLVAAAAGVHRGLAVVQDHGPRGVTGRLHPEGQAERVGAREVPDLGEGEPVLAVQLRGLSDLAGDEVRPLVGDARLLRVKFVGDLVVFQLVKRVRRHESRDGQLVRALPLREPPPCGNAGGRQSRLLVGHRLAQLGDPPVLLVGREQQRRHRGGAREVRRLPGLVDVLEEREQRVEVLLLDRVVLVVVASAALEGQPEEGRPERGHPVHHVGDPELLFNDPALLVLHVQPVERRRQPLLLGGIRQQVAGELPGEELVEPLVAVERPDHPVAVRPDGPRLVVLVALGVGEPGHVQPVRGHPLPVPLAFQEPIGHPLVSVGRGVLEEVVRLLGCRRQAGQVERDAAQPHLPRGLRRRLEPLVLQPGADERVDWINDCGLRTRDWGLLEGRQGPRLAPPGPLVDPALDGVDLLGGQLAVGLRRRHPLVGVLGGQSADQLALAALAGDNDGLAVADAEGPLLGVEAELGLAGLLVRAVAEEAVVRQDGQHVAAEVHRRVGGAGRQRDEGEEQQAGGSGHGARGGDGRSGWDVLVVYAPHPRTIRRARGPIRLADRAV
jgi:hypothetical protein